MFVNDQPILKGSYISLLVSSLCLMIFAVTELRQQYLYIEELTQIQSVNEYGIHSGMLVYQLQKERGLSVVSAHRYRENTNNTANISHTSLIKQRVVTSQKLTEFIHHSADQPQTKLSLQIMDIKSVIKQLRLQIDQQQLSAKQIVIRYGLLNTQLIDVLAKAVRQTKRSANYNGIMAYYYLLKSAELLGVERASLTHVFIERQLDAEQSIELQKNRTARQTLLALFELTDIGDNHQLLANITNNPQWQEVEVLFDWMLEKGSIAKTEWSAIINQWSNSFDTPIKIVNAQQWWVYSTQRIDLMHQLALKLSGQIAEDHLKALNEANQTFYWHILFYVVSGMIINGLLSLWINARMRMAELMTIAQHRQNLALEGTGTVLWDYNARNKTFLFSKQWLKMLGLDQNQTVLDASAVSQNPQNPAFSLLGEIVNSHMNDGVDDCRMDHQIKTGSGQWIWISACSKVTGRDDKSKIKGVVGTFTDISERKVLEESLRASQQRLQFHLVNSPLAIVEWNTDFEVSFWNLAAEKLFGYTAEQAIGRHSSFIVPPTYKDKVDRLWLQLMGESVGGSETLVNVNNCAELVQCEWNNTPLLDEHNTVTGVASIIENITQRKLSEERQHRAQKMEALGNLTSGIAHDFNNMLGVVLGYAELLQLQLHDRPKLAKYATQIYHASERGTQLTSNLLSFSSMQPKQQSIVNINLLINAEKELLHQSLTALIELRFKLGAQLWPIKADAGAFEDMLLNMSINAMHAMPDGGQLSISTHNENLSQASAARLNLPIGDYVCLVIEDTGCGINEGLKAKIFDPYFTTKGKGGSGLGLSQVYGFIRACGGAIDVFSQPGLGSRFVLYFPRQCDSLMSTPLLDCPVEVSLRGCETILVVDDEPSLVELARNILMNQGYNVYCACDAEQALAILARQLVDLVLSDIIMPKMNGYQLAGQIKQLYPKVKIRLISGYEGDVETRGAAIELDFPVIKKPYKASVLLGHIRNQLDTNTGSST